MKICVVIPSFNEEKAIGDVVRTIKTMGLDVLVIDDGSSDNTASLAGASGAAVIRHELNKGKGSSLRDGFEYAVKNGYQAVITMDGDGQHLPSDLAAFIRRYDRTKAPIIVGNRMDDVKDMPMIRQLTNKFMSWMISCICKQKIPDTQCGYRFIHTDVLKSVDLVTDKYDSESEILIKASRAHFVIDFCPVATVYEDQVSQIHPLVDTIRFFRMLFHIAGKK